MQEHPSEFAAVIGLDWADRKHDVCVQVPGRASHNAALRALAFKWVRILYRCWVDRTPYDEARYLNALQRRHAPLLKFAAARN